MKQHEPEGQMLGNETYLLYVAPSNPIPITSTIALVFFNFKDLVAKQHPTSNYAIFLKTVVIPSLLQSNHEYTSILMVFPG